MFDNNNFVSFCAGLLVGGAIGYFAYKKLNGNKEGDKYNEENLQHVEEDICENGEPNQVTNEESDDDVLFRARNKPPIETILKKSKESDITNYTTFFDRSNTSEEVEETIGDLFKTTISEAIVSKIEIDEDEHITEDEVENNVENDEFEYLTEEDTWPPEESDDYRIITEYEFDVRTDGYTKIRLDLWADGVVSDEYNDIIRDCEEAFGIGTIAHFLTADADDIYIRNNLRKTDYEILKNLTPYSPNNN